MIILILNYLKVQSLHKHTINLVIVMTNNILFATIQKDSIYIKNSETQNSIQSQNTTKSFLSQVPVSSQQIFKKQPSFVSKQKQELYIYIHLRSEKRDSNPSFPVNNRIISLSYKPFDHSNLFSYYTSLLNFGQKLLLVQLVGIFWFLQ